MPPFTPLPLNICTQGGDVTHFMLGRKKKAPGIQFVHVLDFMVFHEIVNI